MPPAVWDVGIVIYEYLKIIVAFAAVVLAIKWKKNEFLAGLFFLLLYTIFDAMDFFCRYSPETIHRNLAIRICNACTRLFYHRHVEDPALHGGFNFTGPTRY